MAGTINSLLSAGQVFLWAGDTGFSSYFEHRLCHAPGSAVTRVTLLCSDHASLDKEKLAKLKI